MVIDQIKYNQPIEVSKSQYDNIVKLFAGLVAHRYDEDTKKYYIKVWSMKYAPKIKYVIDNYK